MPVSALGRMYGKRVDKNSDDARYFYGVSRERRLNHTHLFMEDRTRNDRHEGTSAITIFFP
ncbi:hypothetical protein SERLA73DRAFT_187537 [Serpula lacrymans var. lacrymans S7.3]|uniref:Uncharacterized protein n=2 Tax=Serpula lacrymans var. lacrymans TaxID=341189 RepID=F8Q9F5_SERL3|nr:uncharacterized protein SERLADRAFT_477191 [Serpula lacrymans var. lacrymans S7.9]EGN95210.1 hypothetical protein SERLA73DRAFT_187537 [Serpula lacrymans var. lacrymans S7.3]EGO20737.1 hypothetical protein SERLADRAFT_477191 [Serpula lacrymans var. lacrymans S7.9]